MYTMIQLTDLHIDNNDPELELLNPRDNFNEFIKYAGEFQYDKIVVTGDVAEEKENYQTIFMQLYRLCDDIISVAGNHDPEEAYRLLNQKKPYFMEPLEEFLVLYLDSDKGMIDDEQLYWLKDVVVNSQKDIMIFLHHPILDCGNTVMDRRYPLRNRKEVQNILRNTKQKVYVFCGHYHWEQEVQSGNIKQYITPSLLYQFDKDAENLRVGSDDFGFRVIRISEDHVDTYVEFI